MRILPSYLSELLIYVASRVREPKFPMPSSINAFSRWALRAIDELLKNKKNERRANNFEVYSPLESSI